MRLRCHRHTFLLPNRYLPVLLLNGVFLGCGAEPEAPNIAEPVAPRRPEVIGAATLPSVKFTDVTTEAGIDFTHQNFALGEKLLPETMGSGVAFMDYDGDGHQDLLFVNSAPWPGQEAAEPGGSSATQALYRNDGTGHFVDVTADAGLDVTIPGMGVAVGDYDNDGDPDIYITALGGGYLFRNDGGTYLDVTEEANARGGEGWQASAAFFDYDNDGDLDLFICDYVVWSPEIDRGINTPLAGTKDSLAYDPPTAFNGSRNLLLRNDAGRFTDVSAEAGLEIRTPDLKAPMAKSLGVAPYDVDGDGFVDVAIANDTVPNFLFRNLGDGTFEEIGMVSGVAFDQAGQARGAMGIDWGDFKNDGSLALAIANFANEMAALYVVDDPESLQFSDLANIYGLGAPTQPPLKFGLFFFDYDLDGRLDLLLANGHLESDIERVQASETYEQPAQLFWNSGRPGRSMFTQVGPAAAGPDLFQPIVGRGSAYADIDGDGDLDVVLTSNGGRALLLRNDGGNAYNWLRLKLQGGEGSNRDAIGAKVTVETDGLSQARQLFPAKGYLSSVEFPMTFGLGSSGVASRVTITWPSGKTTELIDVEANRFITIDEEAGEVR